MIHSWGDHIGKRTDWSLIYFLIYAYLNILACHKFSLSVSIYCDQDTTGSCYKTVGNWKMALANKASLTFDAGNLENIWSFHANALQFFSDLFGCNNSALQLKQLTS